MNDIIPPRGNTGENFKNIRPYLHFNDWTPEELQRARQKLNLTQDEVAAAIDVSGATISNIEKGKTTNPWALMLYGIILERYYAATKGYIPAFRKPGTSNYLEK